MTQKTTDTLAGGRDQVVDALRELWKESLRVDAVEADQSFFALGGNSMTAIRMLTVVLTRYGAEVGEVDLHRFFEQPTLTTLADLLHSAPPAA